MNALKKLQEHLPNPEETPGLFLIIPLETFTEKGYNWLFQLKFEKKVRVYPQSDKTVLKKYLWANPVEEVIKTPIERKKWRRGNTYTLEVCRCPECLEGRRYVKKNNWVPKRKG